jgi:UDP-galactopyranose mutase
MKIEASSPEQHIDKLSDDRRQAMTKLRQTIFNNLLEGFEEKQWATE